MIPTNDYVFKRIFGHIGNEKITIDLLDSILNTKIETIELDGNRILERDVLSDKLGILDIKATLNNQILTDIEMQLVSQDNMEERILFYWSKMYTKELTKGNDYSQLKKTIVILLADFEFSNFESIPKYHTEWQIREKDFPKVILTNVLELHILELPKLKKLIEKNDLYKNKKLDLWIKFLLTPDKLEVNDMEENEAVKEAKDVLDKIRQDEKEEYLAELRLKYILDSKAQKAYARRKGLEEGREEGLKQGIEEGLKQGIEEGLKQGLEQGLEQGTKKAKIEIAKNMLKEKIDIEIIQKVTGLTKDEIKKLS